MGEIVVAMLLVALIVAVQITDGLATRKEMKFLKERTDDLLLRTHRLEHPPKKLGTTAGEISVDVILNKEEFDEQIDEINRLRTARGDRRNHQHSQQTHFHPPSLFSELT